MFSLDSYDERRVEEQCEKITKEGVEMLSVIESPTSLIAEKMLSIFNMGRDFELISFDYNYRLKFSPFTDDLIQFWNDHKSELMQMLPEQSGVPALNG